MAWVQFDFIRDVGSSFMTRHGHEAPYFDAGRYPQTYVFSRLSRWILVSVGLLLFVGCLFGLVYFGFVVDMLRPGRIVTASMLAVFGALGLYLAVGARFYRVILSADGIEVFDGLRRRILKRANIAGRQRLVNQIGAGWTLVPSAGLGRKLQLSSFLKTDRDFSDWILSFPDLDEDKKKAADHEVREATDVLMTRGLDAKGIQRLRQLATWSSRIVIGLAIGAYLLPDPHHVVAWVCIALPWVTLALVRQFQPLYRLGGPKNSPLPDLSLQFFMPGIVLSLLALMSISPVGWQPTIELWLVFSVALMATAMLVDPWLRKHRVAALLLSVLCSGYGYGAGLEVNALLDRSTPINYPVAVLSKHVGGGRGHTYHLGLAPWGPYRVSGDVLVPLWRYRQTQVGDTVCVALRTGALGVAWYTVGSCGV
jgi:hypothetical protein